MCAVFTAVGKRIIIVQTVFHFSDLIQLISKVSFPLK